MRASSPVTPSRTDGTSECIARSRRETLRPPAYSIRAQRAGFDAFRTEFNQERPHEASEDETPASRYTPSPRGAPTSTRCHRVPGMERERQQVLDPLALLVPHLPMPNICRMAESDRASLPLDTGLLQAAARAACITGLPCARSTSSRSSSKNRAAPILPHQRLIRRYRRRRGAARALAPQGAKPPV